MWWNPDILQYFTEVRHVILFWVKCPFLLFATSLFKTHFKIMLPSATIYQAVYFVKVFKLKYCIHSCSIRISIISFSPHLTPYDTRQNSSSGRKGTFVFERPGFKSLSSYSYCWGDFPEVPQATAETVHWITYNYLHSHPPQFIIHRSSYNLKLFKWATDSVATVL
jgi:hypothetical protein